MPASTYLPSREGELVTWSDNFSTLINADPTAYGLTLTQASDYAALQTAYANAYATANQDPTRTRPTIIAKNVAKQTLIESTRQLVDIVQAYPGTTDEMRGELQITIRDYEPSPTPIPANAPIFSILKVSGYKISYSMREPNSDSRGKPEGVIGAQLLGYVGETAPANPADWQSLGLVTRPLSYVILPSALYPAGSKVWLSAAWVNPKGQVGPLSDPTSCYISSGLSQAA